MVGWLIELVCGLVDGRVDGWEGDLVGSWLVVWMVAWVVSWIDCRNTSLAQGLLHKSYQSPQQAITRIAVSFAGG